jgi:hypothetical protein
MDAPIDDPDFLANSCFSKKQLSYPIAQKLAKEG